MRTEIVGTILLTAVLLFGGHLAIVAAQEATETDRAAEKRITLEQIRAVREAREEERALRRAEALVRLQRYASRIIDSYLTSLSRLKIRIQSSSLSADLQTSIIAQIDTRITRLTELKNNIQTSTFDQIKEELKEARDEAVAIKVVRGRYNAQLLVHRFDNLFAKLDRTIQRLEERISAQGTAGKDVSELEAIVAQAKAKIVQAKEKLAQAKAKFDTLTPTSIKDVNDASAAARADVAEAIKLTKEAHRLLQSLIPSLRALETGAEPKDSGESE